jgi:Na+-transporting NADH:ubiquinone oxidoreductase subunit B
MLRSVLDRIAPFFDKGKPLYPLNRLFEAADTFFYSPADKAHGSCHVRDALDFKRLMTMVIIALGPCILMAMYNTGYQANLAISETSAVAIDSWRTSLLETLGVPFDPSNIFACFLHGLLYFLPVYIVTMVVGIGWEVLFATVRGHEVNEGFFVTGMLFPLILPPTIPLWQVALAVSFGVVLGKEVFGGTGKNFLNPALTARAFLFFAYAQNIAGNQVWVAADGYTGATPLSIAMNEGPRALAAEYSWFEAVLGRIPGSMGETSVLACLFGAAFLVIVGVASWRIMLSMLAGAVATGLLFNSVSGNASLAFSVPVHWHLVLGGFAFGLVFMATDPVTAAMTRTGQYIYGALIGAIVLMVRVVNPGYPEGVMLAILFGNVTAPLIDYYVVKANIKRRAARTALETESPSA